MTGSTWTQATFTGCAHELNSAASILARAVDQRIFVDYDGTITEHDLLDTIAQTFGDPEVYAEVDRGLDENRLTLHEVLRREFEPVRAPLDEVVGWVLEHAVDPAGLPRSRRRLPASGAGGSSSSRAASAS